MSYGGFALSASTSDRERVYYYIAVDVQTRCWNWLGGKTNRGYGRLKPPGRKTMSSHRFSYEAFVGPIPDGLQIDHLCRNTLCVNPEHLEPVTAQVNVRRGESPGARALRRTHCLQGHPYAEFGVMRSGRRICRECAIAASRVYKEKARIRRAATWAKYGLGESA